MAKRPVRQSPPPRIAHYFTPQAPPHASSLKSGEDLPGEQNRAAFGVRIEVRGHSLELAAGAGVFSKTGLDAGSRLLIETAQWSDGSQICDLGCGWGAIGCFSAALSPQSRVWMCDINGRAAQLARLNAQRNQLANITVWCGDGLDAARSNVFDIVLCNPPVRAGNAVIAKLFGDAQRGLREDGVLWIVLRTAQGAKSWQKRLEQQFGNCETVARDGGYRILKCVK